MLKAQNVQKNELKVWTPHFALVIYLFRQRHDMFSTFDQKITAEVKIDMSCRLSTD